MTPGANESSALSASSAVNSLFSCGLVLAERMFPGEDNLWFSPPASLERAENAEQSPSILFACLVLLRELPALQQSGW